MNYAVLCLQRLNGFFPSHCPFNYNIYNYCILRGRIKGFNCSITTILFEVGSYSGWDTRAVIELWFYWHILTKKPICLLSKCVKLV